MMSFIKVSIAIFALYSSIGFAQVEKCEVDDFSKTVSEECKRLLQSCKEVRKMKMTDKFLQTYELETSHKIIGIGGEMKASVSRGFNVSYTYEAPDSCPIVLGPNEVLCAKIGTNVKIEGTASKCYKTQLGFSWTISSSFLDLLESTYKISQESEKEFCLENSVEFSIGPLQAMCPVSSIKELIEGKLAKSAAEIEEELDLIASKVDAKWSGEYKYCKEDRECRAGGVSGWDAAWCENNRCVKRADTGHNCKKRGQSPENTRPFWCREGLKCHCKDVGIIFSSIECRCK